MWELLEVLFQLLIELPLETVDSFEIWRFTVTVICAWVVSMVCELTFGPDTILPSAIIAGVLYWALVGNGGPAGNETFLNEREADR